MLLTLVLCRSNVDGMLVNGHSELGGSEERAPSASAATITPKCDVIHGEVGGRDGQEERNTGVPKGKDE